MLIETSTARLFPQGSLIVEGINPQTPEIPLQQLEAHKNEANAAGRVKRQFFSFESPRILLLHEIPTGIISIKLPKSPYSPRSLLVSAAPREIFDMPDDTIIPTYHLEELDISLQIEYWRRSLSIMRRMQASIKSDQEVVIMTEQNMRHWLTEEYPMSRHLGCHHGAVSIFDTRTINPHLDCSERRQSIIKDVQIDDAMIRDISQFTGTMLSIFQRKPEFCYLSRPAILRLEQPVGYEFRFPASIQPADLQKFSGCHFDLYSKISERLRSFGHDQAYFPQPSYFRYFYFPPNTDEIGMIIRPAIKNYSHVLDNLGLTLYRVEAKSESSIVDREQLHREYY